MKWNYRVVQHDDFVELIEVFYEGNNLVGYTETGQTGNNLQDLYGSVMFQLNTVRRCIHNEEDVLKPEDLPEESGVL